MKTFCNDNNDLCIVFSSCIWGANCNQNWAMSIIALRCKHCYYFPQFLRSDLLCRISTMNLRNDCKQLSFCISYFFRSEFLHPSNNRPCWVKHELLHSLILIRSKVLQNRYDIENLIQNYCTSIRIVVSHFELISKWQVWFPLSSNYCTRRVLL